MEDIAAKAATKTTQVMKRKEVEGDLNFVTDLKSLNKKLQKDNIIARFPDPEGGDPIDFEMMPMTPGQTAVYYNTLLGHTFWEASAGESPDPELDDEQRQKLEDELAVKKYDDKLLNILESCIISHPGLTAEQMREWEPFYVISLHNALIEGSRPSKDVARFSDVDPSK
ncbi:hypothetical protein C6499_22610 [Candidatus Poribacteria bacterium]|nr:MAG: hypothetical protein C6499_22610 [Candidatus Poribacteria bacterium]